MPHTTVMLDHPGWIATSDGHARAVRTASGVFAVMCRESGNAEHSVDVALVGGATATAPVLDVTDPAGLAGNDPVADELRAAGRVSRLRNPDLWDAIATSIVRQVIRAGQARKLYREFSRVHGEHIETSAGEVLLFPTPDVVLSLPDEEFARLGLAFKRRPLRAAAEAYREFGDKWAGLPPADLAAEIQTVPRIGPWTAGATVADVTNDYALYPFADLGVRTWAKRLAPGRSWPDDESQFARVWQELAGAQLSERTLLTLAWGVRHANGVAL
ncbi:DNA-3-methyladenine glycosylase family protein [Saccharopolyspora phatthalungensis]|uniref:DNA-3-methyladenine glycosylase II n=1 Tax=Saccharopolyspora phatthalungensis TaxID=664693 RepID=A0A840Q9R1_9PSEU|nr:hypothetical protein [Saccharopolyspora phatthalungensis]MBB5156471.1 DNA-3-methyladenine glycosylase II [Saccharopolyspora phatthalungensis]